MKVLLVASEVAPFIKTGGLGDVCGSLPYELKKLGVDVRVALPKYKNIKDETLDGIDFLDYIGVHLAWRNQSASIHCIDGDVPVYFIENDYYFGREQLYGYADDNERFAFFSKSVIEMLPVIGFKPDVIHLNDWQVGPIALLLKEFYCRMSFYAHMKTMFTIHNLQHQGVFPMESLYIMDLSDSYFNADSLEFYGQISYMKAGLIYSDFITTVSKTYALEIQEPRYGYGMDGILRMRKDVLTGIVNGLDYEIFNPETDTKIYANFSAKNPSGKRTNKSELQKDLGLPQKDVPVLSIVSRLADQKGLDLIAEIIDDLMREDLQFIVLGTGDGRYEYMFSRLSEKYPDKISANLKFDETLANRIYAGSDIFLMPSLFEPCGLGQLISMRYGTIPVVRRTGGLADTVTEYNAFLKEGNGFVFNEYYAGELKDAISRAVRLYCDDKEAWSGLVQNAIASDFSWMKSAKEYIRLYQMLRESVYAFPI